MRKPAAGTTKQRGCETPARCWDVVLSVNGTRYYRRFTSPKQRAADATAYMQELLKGWADPTTKFDPASKMFYRPEDLPGARPAAAVTVADLLLEFWAHRCPAYRDATRAWSARAFRRGIPELLRPDAPACPPAVRAQLKAAFKPDCPGVDGDAAAWLARWSMPMVDVKTRQLQQMMAVLGVKADGERCAPKTYTRYVDSFVPAWQYALDTEVITHDPWPSVHRARRATRNGEVVGNGDVRAVNKEMVASQAQVCAIAEHIAGMGDGYGVYRAFIHSMGNAGLRPGEARVVRVGDVEFVKRPGKPEFAKLTLRASATAVSKQWRTKDDPEEFGPLKGRATGETRVTVMSPASTRVLREHLRTYRGKAKPSDLLFVSHTGHRIIPQNFGPRIWEPARKALFAGTPLENVVCHDLRHAACTAWLNAGVRLKTACNWSGHRDLSVFLDIYQGVTPGDEEMSMELVAAHEEAEAQRAELPADLSA